MGRSDDMTELLNKYDGIDIIDVIGILYREKMMLTGMYSQLDMKFPTNRHPLIQFSYKTTAKPTYSLACSLESPILPLLE